MTALLMLVALLILVGIAAELEGIRKALVIIADELRRRNSGEQS